MKPCRTCGTQWEPRKQGQRYCSDECNPNIFQCAREGCSVWFKSFGRQKYCSAECRGPAYGIMKAVEVKKCLGCDEPFVTDRKLAKYCADSCKPHWRKCAVPECLTEMLMDHTTRFCVEHRNHGNKARPSAEEYMLAPLMAERGFDHTGMGTFWITWKDGTNHNPDFVDRKNRRVVEYFGKYWHRHQRGLEPEIIAAYQAVGWDCEILWTEDFHRLIPGQKVH